MSDAEVTPDHDALLRANLERVFNERDPDRRALAMADLYVWAAAGLDDTGISSIKLPQRFVRSRPG
ncbi:hypothetical protein [Nitrospirillum pindoramense]|uniref:Uncharacterized protein n=1 Tax=Nitrospirillum amazonense TaxID=28077 RepID=A0A560H2V1_9PROT|nr:hypothetical protein [Nitrospirillum amazonense]TWB40645.1 hypothetical protein FBZ90_109248 [Nitrospirillum amazonense]